MRIDRTTTIEQKVESLLAKMTLEEKIGQMSMVRHFDDTTDNDIANKFIGSVIHSQGPLPGERKSMARKIYCLAKKSFINQIRNSFNVLELMRCMAKIPSKVQQFFLITLEWEHLEILS